MTKKCEFCGKEFEVIKNTRRIYCSESCSRKSNYIRSKDLEKKRKRWKENTNAAVVEIAKKAREAGMTYGQYVAKIGI